MSLLVVVLEFPCLTGCSRFLYHLEFIRSASFRDPDSLRCTPSRVKRSLLFTKESHGLMNLTPTEWHSAPTLQFKGLALLCASLLMLSRGRRPTIIPLLLFSSTVYQGCGIGHEELSVAGSTLSKEEIVSSRNHNERAAFVQCHG